MLFAPDQNSEPAQYILKLLTIAFDKRIINFFIKIINAN